MHFSLKSDFDDENTDYHAYRSLINKIHRLVIPRNYLEIGVYDGGALNEALDTTRCIGVDPAPLCDRKMPKYCQLFLETSDEFFQRHKPGRLTGLLTYDMAFIDGMHLFEYTLRDFINVERKSSRHSVVILNGCMPKTEKTGSRKRETEFWSGDVWKIIPVLEKYRPDLKIQIFDVDPSGIAVITDLNSKNSVLEENLSEILSEYIHQDYNDYLKLSFKCADNLDDIKISKSQFILRSVFHFIKRIFFPLPIRVYYKIRRVINGRFFPMKNLKTLDPYPCLHPHERILAAPKEQPESPQIMTGKIPKMLGVLLCYNDSDMLPDAIESLLENNHNLVVWDHGSTDETAEVLDKYEKHFVERTFLPREFDFYKLYPTMSQHLMEHYTSQYDWISWPDQDEILEGPDRSKSYTQFVQQVLDDGYSHVRFDMFNYWFTELDDESIESPTERMRHYSSFPEFPALIRAWRADVTNERKFNHNSVEGLIYPDRFRLKHYPMRSYDKAIQRIIFNRSGLQKGRQNFHYNELSKKLGSLQIEPKNLHFDDGVNNHHTSITCDFAKLYGLRE